MVYFAGLIKYYDHTDGHPHLIHPDAVVRWSMLLASEINCFLASQFIDHAMVLRGMSCGGVFNLYPLNPQLVLWGSAHNLFS